MTDLAGVLDTDAMSEAGSVITALEHDARVQLFALFVRSTDRMAVTDYAGEVARVSSLGGNDALLVVAIDDRSDALWVGDALDEVTEGELDEILADAVEPRLAAGDYAGAVGAAAGGLARALGVPATATPTPEPITTATATAAAPTGSDEGGISVFTVLLVLLGGGGIIAGLIWLMKGRAREGRPVGAGSGSATIDAADLPKLATSLLLETDDALAAAEEEAGFAEAEFPKADVKPFREALAQAKEELKAAFAVRQRLDDAEPETDAERGAMQQEIVDRCRRATALLDDQRQRFEQLRDLERRAPEVLEALAGKIAASEGRIAAAERAMGRMAAFADASWEPVRGNLDGVRDHLASASEQLAAGRAAVAGDDRGAAALAAQNIEAALAEAAHLLDAIDEQEKALQEARETFEKEMIAASADVTQARVAVDTGRVRGFEVQVQQAESLLQEAQKAAAAPKPDYVAAHRLAAQANAAADAVLAAVLETGERLTRLRAAMDASMRNAHLTYRQASAYIAGRRTAVGPGARTRLAGAERLLARVSGLAARDPASAAGEAREAQRLAEQAYLLAKEDFTRAGAGGRPAWRAIRPTAGRPPGRAAGGGFDTQQRGRSRGGRW